MEPIYLIDSLHQFCNSFPKFMIELFIEDNIIIKW